MCCPVAAMDGVLEGATVLCLCKLACSLLFLPSLAASHSSVSFCCCCLLVFTDFLVTGEYLHDQVHWPQPCSGQEAPSRTYPNSVNNTTFKIFESTGLKNNNNILKYDFSFYIVSFKTL